MKAALLTLSAIFLLAGSTMMVFAAGTINSGNPVPYVGTDDASVEFVILRLTKDYGGDEEEWEPYATGLAETVSQLTPAEQTEVWYGP